MKKGPNIMIGQTTLLSMEVEFKQTPCHAWFLLQRNGLMEDADFTPYLFRCERKRDEILTFLQRQHKWVVIDGFNDQSVYTNGWVRSTCENGWNYQYVRIVGLMEWIITENLILYIVKSAQLTYILRSDMLTTLNTSRKVSYGRKNQLYK